MLATKILLKFQLLFYFNYIGPKKKRSFSQNNFQKISKILKKYY